MHGDHIWKFNVDHFSLRGDMHMFSQRTRRKLWPHMGIVIVVVIMVMDQTKMLLLKASLHLFRLCVPVFHRQVGNNDQSYGILVHLSSRSRCLRVCSDHWEVIGHIEVHVLEKVRRIQLPRFIHAHLLMYIIVPSRAHYNCMSSLSLPSTGCESQTKRHTTLELVWTLEKPAGRTSSTK